MLTTVQRFDLNALAAQLGLPPPLALGLGAGLYFEYSRRLEPSPTHFCKALHPSLDSACRRRLARFQSDPAETLREALSENALWFILDRAPMTALMGMERLAEELPHYAEIPDWRECLWGMAQQITDSDTLYRRSYVRFLEQADAFLPGVRLLVQDLKELVVGWDELGIVYQEIGTNGDATHLERAGQRLRRIAFREENFWGKVLETTQRV